MKNKVDGGEAIVEAFRKLGVDYILSSPGTEWAPVWEALADQIQQGKAGPKLLDVWHETLAVDMAAGYTLATGKDAGSSTSCRVRLTSRGHGDSRSSCRIHTHGCNFR